MQSLRLEGPTSSKPTKAGRGHSKSLNLRTILQLVHTEHTTTRAQVARLTGLTRATVSTLVAELIENDLVVEAGVAASAGGKPPTNICINPNGRQLIAVDLSARPFRGCVVDLLLRPVGEVLTSEPADNHEDAVDNLIARLIEASDNPLAGVSIATPGVVAADGTVVEATNLGWHDYPLASRLADRFDVAVSVVNDAHAAAVAAHAELVRARRDTDTTTGDLLLVRIAEGLGAGIVLGGGLHLGSHRSAGEIGHVVVDTQGDACQCGNSGCLETIASRTAIVRAVAGTDVVDPATTLDMLAETHGADRVASAVERAGTSIGEVASVLVNALDVSEIVINMSTDGADELAAATARELQNRVLPVLRSDLDVSVMSSPNLPLLGAAALLRSQSLGMSVA